MEQMTNRGKEAQKITIIGMGVNFILAVIKFLAGLFGGSAALVADAIHSLSDFISDIVVIIGVKITSKPADEDHNYGHGKVETVSTVLIGIFLIVVSISLLRSSGLAIYRFFFKGEELTVPKFFVLYIVIISIISKEALYQMTKIVGKKIKNDAVIANAWHHRTDALSSVAALIGVLLAILLGKDYAVFDPIASVVVSILIFKVGLSIILSNMNQLIDAALKEEEVQKLKDILKSISDIKGYHKLKTRRLGYYISIDVHIFVEKNLNVLKSHDIATLLEDKIYQTFGKETIISVHVEPYDDDKSNELNYRE